METCKVVNKCPVCQVPSSSSCSNCFKVVYCGKEHQKAHRKLHKKECFPAVIKSDPVLGQHLAASRDILEGQVIFHEEPLIIGPRSNLTKFYKICLGCCSSVDGIYTCSKCKWPVCGEQCEKASVHAKFECELFAANQVHPAKTQEEYLCVTFLRGLLLKRIAPEKWDELRKFESHSTSRNTVNLTLKQSQAAFKFITEKCKLKEFDKPTVDFIYGIVLVNGYGDSSTFAVKLYSKAGKISHACIPNTRTRVVPTGLDVIAAVKIKAGQPLTQLYGRMFKGTHRRQELLQNVYYFSCSCPRCKDPTEFGTYFSSVKCRKCKGYLVSMNPLKIDSKWICEGCSQTTTFIKAVVPALGEIFKQSEMTEDSPLFTDFEIWAGDELLEDEETVAVTRLKFVLETLEKLSMFEEQLVHKNHYAMMPLKTACIATSHSLLQNLEKFDSSMFDKVIAKFACLCEEVYSVVNVFLPGFTSERGILLFYLSEVIRLDIENPRRAALLEKSKLAQRRKEMESLQKQSFEIMSLEPDDDTHKQLVFQYLNKYSNTKKDIH